MCAVFDPHLPTGNVHVTREPVVGRQPRGMTLRSMRNEIVNHAKERTWSLSWHSGDQLWQLVEMLTARYGRETLVQLMLRISIKSKNQTVCSGDDRVWGKFSIGLQVAMTTCTNPGSAVTIASTGVSTKNGPERMAT